jgi:hypothetical protein
MHRGRLFAAILAVGATCGANAAVGQLHEQSPNQPPALEETPTSQPGATPPAPTQSQAQTKEKLSRVWANEPLLVRLARDKFGAELTETDAKFFAAVAESKWADMRPSADTTYNSEEPTSWKESAKLRADRLVWLFTDPSAVKIVPSRGVWLRGVNIQGKLDLYRCDIPFSLTFYDCLFDNGINISHAKLEELDIRNCCSAAIQARSVQIAENVYLLTTCVFGGLDFIDAQIGGDFDFTGGLAFHGSSQDDLKKKGIALNFHDAKVGGDVKLTGNFRAYGQVRLIGATLGRSFLCTGARFVGGGQSAIDARSAHFASNVSFSSGFRAEGGVEMRRAHIGGDLDCDGGRFFAAPDVEALDADLANVGGQVNMGDGFHAEGEVRLINAVVGSDIGCNNGHFLNPTGNALCLDGAAIGRCLRIGADTSAPTDKTKNLPLGFLSRGTIRLWGTQINQDIIANGAQFEAPGGVAILANNMKVGSRVDLSGVKAQGSVNLFSADIEHELDLRTSQFDAKGAYGNIALWANGMHVRGHVYCNQVEAPEGIQHLRVSGVTSFQFATIAMHWDLSGAQFVNPGSDALDASDCRVGGYVNLDTVLIDGRASFSRAKIDGMWIINKSVDPEKMKLDMRFAHIWVIKDERLDDWPPAGQLQLEGLVYDHFDDDSPLDVNDRLAWLRRQYTPIARHRFKLGIASPKPTTTTEHRSPGVLETFGQMPVRRQETRAQHAEIVPAQYEAATMPAPQMAPPNPSTVAPSTVPPSNQPNRSYPMVVTAEETREKASAKTSVATDKKSATESSTAKSEAAEAKTDEDNDQTAEAEAPAAPAEKPSDPFGRRYITQPYTQLASVYRAIGQDEQASDVLVARAERIGELAPPFSAQGLWYGYLGRLIGYGYEPFRAIKIGLVIIAVGAVVFAVGAHRNLMSETKLAERVLSNEGESGIVSPTYPRFNAIIYSLDVFLPFVDLNQVCYWIPGEKHSKPRVSRNCLMHIGRYSVKWSSVLHGYLWFQTLAGWTLCTLLAAAVTGIVQS